MVGISLWNWGIDTSTLDEIISWFCLIWILFIYFFYPGILCLVYLFFRNPVRKGAYEPTVAILVSAWNEESIIAEKLENILSLDYPKEKLEIMVVSDASTDRTDEIVRSFADRGVKLHRMSEHEGKIPGLNDAIPKVNAEIIVLTDANVMYNREALKELMSNFADPKVGAVNGEHIFLNRRESTVERGVGFYWKYETLLKRIESGIFSNVFITGAMIALRRELYPQNVGGELNLDNVLPLAVINKGLRVVYEQKAVVTEETARNPKEEFRGKVRTTIRGFWMLKKIRDFISIRRHPIFIFHLMCRKVFRWLVAPFLIVLFFGNLMLVTSPTYRLCFFIQIMFYLSAIIGWVFDKTGIRFKYFNIIYYFCLINTAALLGFLKFMAGQKVCTWIPPTRKD